MDKYEKLLNMLMDFNENIRYAAVADSDGQILWNSQRTGLKNIVSPEETKQTIRRALQGWKENTTVKNYLGSGLYSISSYEKIKRISIPLDGGKMLFCTINNEPLVKSSDGKKRYGNIAEMGKILSIVDFIKSQK